MTKYDNTMIVSLYSYDANNETNLPSTTIRPTSATGTEGVEGVMKGSASG